MSNKNIINEMIEYYDYRAQWHDDYMSYTNLKDSLKQHAPIINLISDKIKNREILEIGCGTGNWTEILAQFASQIVALDSSQNSLEIARKKLATEQNVILRKSNIFEYDNFSKKYDTIFATDFYSHVPLKAIPSMISVLKKLIKKNCAIIFIDMTCKKELQKEIIGEDDNGDLICQRILPDGSKYKVIKNFPTEQQLAAQLSDLGGSLKYFNFEYLQRWMVVIEMGEKSNDD